MELANTTAPKGNTELGSLQASHHICINQSIYSLALCVFWLKDTLFNISCSSNDIELIASSTMTHVWVKLI